MKAVYWFSGIFTVACIIAELLKPKEEKKKPLTSREEHEGFTVTRTALGNQEEIRFRGSYDDIMRHLGVIKGDKPPLPPNLDIEGLPSYNFGCPHCGISSMVGENLWRYHELSRTRGYMDNTTTFLSKCKKCNGFMKAKVDHDDF